MAGNVFVIVEQWRGRISAITYELLALGRELADQSLAPLQAILLGHNIRDMASTLGSADSVLYLDHPLLADPLPEVSVEALVGALAGRKAQCILCPMTNMTLGMEALLADRLGVPSVSLCKDLRMVANDYEATCLLYGGRIEAVVSLDATPAVFGVWPGARPAYQGRAERHPPIEDVSVSLPETPTVQLRKYIPPPAGDVDITHKDVLVGVGRGVKNRGNVVLAGHLAESLGGALCGSRPAVDYGWLPLSRQVGSSGLTVKPKLYLAVGISGAPEHVESMRDSGLIVAINTDPSAPVFALAHYGIVADAIEFLPVLIDVIESGKKASRCAASGRLQSPGAPSIEAGRRQEGGE